MAAKTMPGEVGDWLEVHGPGGGPPRRGMILEVLGRPRHEHYRVRWTDDHVSIFFAADGTHIRRAASPRAPEDAERTPVPDAG